MDTIDFRAMVGRRVVLVMETGGAGDFVVGANGTTVVDRADDDFVFVRSGKSFNTRAWPISGIRSATLIREES